VLNVLPPMVKNRTKRVYDLVAGVYPASSYLFHSKAHQCVMEMSQIRDGMRVLEIATGSGEMLDLLVKANPSGATFGTDLSPNMAAQAAGRVNGRANCQAADACHLPFRCESFDAVVCCYLLELLTGADIERSLREVRRVMKTGGSFTLVLVGQHTAMFNRAYALAGSLVPAFWGRQVEARVPALIDETGLRITGDRSLRQGFYPSRILTAKK
jgi:ubiquinone/menaquinone biosynthesis C-methylase UbiE